MPDELQELQRQLLKHQGGDRVMAQVLTAVTLHGLDSVLRAVQQALASGRASGEHVLNLLSRMRAAAQPARLESVNTALTLEVPPLANVSRYDTLRSQGQEVSDVG